MNIEKCIDFTNENKTCFLASTENGDPRVRAMGFWYADETGFYFQTASLKSLCQQLKENPTIEVCFHKPDNMTGTMLRIAGDIEFLDDRELKEKVLADRPFLKNLGLTSEDPRLVIFRLAHGKAHFWNMESNLKPKEFIEF